MAEVAEIEPYRSPYESDDIEGNLNEDIDKMQKALVSVVAAFGDRAQSLRETMHIFLVTSIGLINFVIAYYFLIFNGIWTPDFGGSTVEIWYNISLRVILMSMIVSIIVYCIRMMAKYLLLLGDVRHKISIINSMPSLLKSSGDKKLFNALYGKMTEMLIHLNENKADAVDTIKLESLIEVIKNITNK